MLHHLISFLLLLGIAMPVQAEWSGQAALEYRHFSNAPLDPRQHEDNSSVVLQPEYHYSWDNDRQLFSFIPYYRYDENDPERSHGDIRELAWIKAAESWELRLGIRKVFWGVTESVHLVDIINQTDLVENADGEDKLGQPMLNLALIGDYGTVDLFILPWFRERTFAGVDGRLRAILVNPNQAAQYESDKQDKHIDYALRWSRSIDIWDLGISYFTGTSRDPGFVGFGNPDGLTPYYSQIRQAGLDIQATIEGWLLKLETIKRSGTNIDYLAAAGGLEYTFYGIASSTIDMGLVLEYMYDDRLKTQASPFDDDILLGLRFTFNDTQSTDALIGMIQDRELDTTVYSIEASRRLGDRWKLNLETRYYAKTDSSDTILHTLRKDDYLQMELAFYF